MSAIGTKQTWATALHMSAFGGKADIGHHKKALLLVVLLRLNGPCIGAIAMK